MSDDMLIEIAIMWVNNLREDRFFDEEIPIFDFSNADNSKKLEVLISHAIDL